MGRINLKEIILGVLTVTAIVGSFWLWFQSMSYVSSGEFERFGLPISAVIGLVVAAILFSLTALFVRKNSVRLAVAVVGVGVPYFFVSATIFVLAALAVSILLIVFALHRIRKEFDLSLGFSVAKTLKTGLPLFFTISALIVSLFYFAHLDRERVVESLLPQPAFNVFMQYLGRPLESLTGLSLNDPDATIDEIVTDFVKNQLESQGVPPAALVQSELNRLAGAQRNQLSELLGITLSGDEPVYDVFYTAIASRLKDFVGPYAVYLPAVSAIAFFFAFKTITIPLYFITLLVLWGVVKLMVATHVLHTEKKMVEVERLTL